MPTAAKEQIMAAIQVVLQAALTGVNVKRDPTREVDVYPTIALLDGGHEIDAQNHGFDNVTFTIECESYVMASSDEGLGPAYNDLQARVVAAMVADQHIAGVISVTEVSGDAPVLDEGEGHRPTKAGITRFAVFYLRPSGDPYNLSM